MFGRNRPVNPELPKETGIFVTNILLLYRSHTVISSSSASS